MEKILITGTGRSGTTFLIKLFSFLGFDTGFNRDNYSQFISSNCNSGMERDNYLEPYYILKSPLYIENIGNIVNDKSITIKQVIIPIRDYKSSAKSRAKHKNDCGGLWKAKDENEQIDFYRKIMSNYLYYMVKYDIYTNFIDFDRMIKDKVYLFNKLETILKEKKINLDTFSKVYDEVSETSKPKK